MANEKNAAKKGGFMAWYESYNGKKVTGMVYSLGASVVIIGALFKILHWPGANYVLMGGMFTEAFLFAIGCLDKPHLDFHWDEVFPQIADPNGDPAHLQYLQTVARPNLGGAPAAGAGVAAGPASVAALAASISDKEIATLKGSIDHISKAADQIADLSYVAAATAKLGDKAQEAAAAAEKYAAVATELGKNSEELNKSMAAAAKGAGNLGEDVQKLAKSVADLNAIYGNMLTAVA